MRQLEIPNDYVDGPKREHRWDGWLADAVRLVAKPSNVKLLHRRSKPNLLIKRRKDCPAAAPCPGEMAPIRTFMHLLNFRWQRAHARDFR